MRAQILAVLLGGAWLGVVGCGDDKSAGNKDQFISQYCAVFSSCCKAAGRPSDGAQCRALYGAFTSAADYDQAAGQACLDEARAASDKCDTSMASSPSCDKVFGSGSAGKKKPGETCDSDSDCAPPESGSAGCVYGFVAQANVRQCQVRLPGKAGDSPCVATRDGAITSFVSSGDTIPLTGYVCDRADGLSCNSTSGACEPLAEVGEACSGACVAAAYCAFSEGICKQRVALGEACKADEECAASAYCETAGQTCVARHAQGEACAANSECDSDDCTNQKCAGGIDDFGITLLCGTN